ncbi:hypothetical protein [Fimbriimonas ginsengisoli]|uniref:Uncharacterized protein n=1 Tax=Fimbriimonas ginsengisoli Gsoil 348 TaxID=661478 RepID=A0A068NQZ2_FIMGI|nr:hypothetical protein [Fimbriimonas ginsengisoli]AIE85963.1 hypothetical protein OP10G_2595 [Fimbriimonas ginsengisoli Gsoil 348]
MRSLQSVYHVFSAIQVGAEKKVLRAKWHLPQMDSMENRSEVVRQIEAASGCVLLKPEVELHGIIPANWEGENEFAIGDTPPVARAKVIVTFEAPLADLEALQDFEVQLDEQLLESGVGFVDGHEVERKGDRIIYELISFGPRKAAWKADIEARVAAAGLNPRRIR